MKLNNLGMAAVGIAVTTRQGHRPAGGRRWWDSTGGRTPFRGLWA